MAAKRSPPRLDPAWVSGERRKPSSPVVLERSVTTVSSFFADQFPRSGVSSSLVSRTPSPERYPRGDREQGQAVQEHQHPLLPAQWHTAIVLRSPPSIARGPVCLYFGSPRSPSQAAVDRAVSSRSGDEQVEPRDYERGADCPRSQGCSAGTSSTIPSSGDRLPTTIRTRCSSLPRFCRSISARSA